MSDNDIIDYLIEKNLYWSKDDLRFASVQYYYESGQITGSLRLALREIMKRFAAIKEIEGYEFEEFTPRRYGNTDMSEIWVECDQGLFHEPRKGLYLAEKEMRKRLEMDKKLHK